MGKSKWKWRSQTELRILIRSVSAAIAFLFHPCRKNQWSCSHHWRHIWTTFPTSSPPWPPQKKSKTTTTTKKTTKKSIKSFGLKRHSELLKSNPCLCSDMSLPRVLLHIFCCVLNRLKHYFLSYLHMQMLSRVYRRMPVCLLPLRNRL